MEFLITRHLLADLFGSFGNRSPNVEAFQPLRLEFTRQQLLIDQPVENAHEGGVPLRQRVRHAACFEKSLQPVFLPHVTLGYRRAVESGHDPIKSHLRSCQRQGSDEEQG